jgi:hypothetical protein
MITPCSGKWNLCDSPIEYIHSRAKYYITGEDPFFMVTDVADVEYIYVY